MRVTFDKIKRAFKHTAEKATDSAEKVANPDTYTGSKNVNENRENEVKRHLFANEKGV
jgi:hypothetical protein